MPPARKAHQLDQEMIVRAHARLDQHHETLNRLELLVSESAASARDAAQAVIEHTLKCDGRDQVNAERYAGILTRLKGQDRILWLIISIVGAVATGVAVVVWDILKIKLGLS